MERGASFLLTALAVAGLSLVVGRLPGVEALRVGARDAVLALASHRAGPLAREHADPVVVAIDATSMRAYPGWPWSRARHGRLVERLGDAGALAIAFDVDFSAARDAAADAAFARALADAGNGVLGAFQHFEAIPGLGEVEIVSTPLPGLRAAAQLGSSVVPLERDGSVRHTLPFDVVGEQRLASLALTTFNVANGRATDAPAASGPFDFRLARPRVEVISYVDAMESDAALSRIAGRPVFVGATAAILQDLWPTPISSSMPGVVLHALEYRMHAVHAEGGALLRYAVPSFEAALAAVAAAAGLALAQRAHRRRIWMALVVAAPLPAALALLATTAGDVLFDPLTPSLAATGAYVLRTETVRRRISGLLDRRERWLSALARVGRLEAGQHGGDHGRRALELVGGATEARSLELLLLDPAGRLGSAARWSAPGAASDVPEGAVRRAIDSGRVQVEPDGSPGPVVCVPLLAADRTIGALVAGYAEGARPDPAEARTLESVGALVALATHGEQLLGDLAEARDRAEVASRIKGEFLANMSHEIRTPLAAVIGYAQVLQQPGVPDDERAAMLGAVQSSGEQLLSLVDDVLDLSRIEAEAQQEPGRDSVDPGQLCADVRRLMHDQALRRGLRLDCEVLFSAPAELVTDRDRLRQVLINLVDNAIKFTERGAVKLLVGTADGADRRAGRVRFEVRDTGVGIAHADLERIFDPLCQVDQSFSGRRGGTGLGLSIVQRLVEQLGGRIDVESTPGRGSSFRVDVPFAGAAQDAIAAPPADAPPGDLTGVRVLVAEDGVDNQRIIRMLLGRAGCEVTVAQNGRIACDQVLARGQSFDAVLMDIAMPEMDGHEATRELRAAGFEAPIIALTAHALPGDRAAALAAGCDDYMTKPVDGRELIARLSQQLAKRGPA